MQQFDPDSFLTKILLFVPLAALGGLLGFVMRKFEARQEITVVQVTINTLAAGFAGLLVIFLCKALNLSFEWTGIITGLSGWLGVKATIKLLETYVFKKLGIVSKEPEPKRQRSNDANSNSNDTK